MLDARDLDDPEISELKHRLLSLISSRGLSDSEEVIRTLGWDAASYWYIGGLLIRAGLLHPEGRKAGKLEYIAPSTTQAGPANLSAAEPRGGERSLYVPIMETLRSAWVADHQIRDFVIDLTASQGSRVTGGKWSRPDITLASSSEYKYVPGRFVELRTFEIKTHEGLDVTAVYEALAHRRAAHFSYVLVHVPECEKLTTRASLQRVIDDAEEYGIGVTTFADPRDYRTWCVKVDARKANPDATDLNAFIDTQTDESFKDKILSWCRRV